MLAGRNIGMFVGIFTMTATWVGGGYINGNNHVYDVDDDVVDDDDDDDDDDDGGGGGNDDVDD